jgi:hypothetical protein
MKAKITHENSERRSMPPGRSRLRGASLALAAALLVAGASTPARANVVERNSETLGCSMSCQDTFEVKCTQKADYLCVTLRADSSDQMAMFEATAVGLLPNAMLGQAKSGLVADQGEKTFCLNRPGGLGTMKALVAVNSIGGVSDRAYDLAVQCLDFLTTKGTSVTRKENE